MKDEPTNAPTIENALLCAEKGFCFWGGGCNHTEQLVAFLRVELAKRLWKKLTVGDVLYGFCDGHFHRDSWGDKTVEGVGKDWIAVRLPNGDLDFADGPDIHFLLAPFTEKPKEETL